VLKLPFVVLSAGACCGVLDLFSSSSLEGSWGWYDAANPSGSLADLSLTAAGNTVRGSGNVCWIGMCSPVTITGHRSCGDFNMTLQSSSGFLATYSGQAVGGNKLWGTWNDSHASYTLIFHRE